MFGATSSPTHRTRAAVPNLLPHTVMPAKYWTCPRCGTRNERRYVKCRNAQVWSVDDVRFCEGRRPKRPVRAHQKALRDVTYTEYELLNGQIHGPAMPGEWTQDCCGACGKPPKGKHLDRDHDHTTGRPWSGKPRGLLCGGNQGCNVLLVPWVTAATARGIASAKSLAGEPDAERWYLLSGYLERVEAHYADGT